MRPLAKVADFPVIPRPSVNASDFSPAARSLMNHLRLIALRCRAAARSDLYEACAVLSSSRDVAKNAYAETLMRCLSQALGKTPKLFRPGVTEISFDEAWLMSATETAANKQWDSFEFLVRSRVPSAARRNVSSLIVGLSEQMDQT